MSLMLGGILIGALLLLAAILATADEALNRINRVRAHHLAQENPKRGEVLLKIVEDPAAVLSAVRLLMVAAHVVATALATALAIRERGAWVPAAAAAVMVFVVFVFAEMVPRTYTVQRTDKAALTLARPIFFISRLLRPLSKVLLLLANATMLLLPGRGLPKGPFVTEEEIRHMVDMAEEEEEIQEEERELIHSIFEFGDTVVREVMVPRPDMVTVEATATLDKALETIIEAGYSRIPIYQGDNDNIIGVLYAKDLMKRMHESDQEVKVPSLGRAPTFIPEQKKVAELLREMQQKHVHMAIVVDEYGGTAGLVTIEDLIEEIVGEIVDEYDKEEPLVEPIDETSMRVDAKMPIDEVNEILQVELPHEEWDTVGGLVFGLTGRVPVPGETVRYDSVEFRTERVAGRRIQKVVITRTPPPLEEAVSE